MTTAHDRHTAQVTAMPKSTVWQHIDDARLASLEAQRAAIIAERDALRLQVAALVEERDALRADLAALRELSAYLSYATPEGSHE